MKDYFKQNVAIGDYVVVSRVYNKFAVGKIVSLSEATMTLPTRAGVLINKRVSSFNTCNIVKVPKPFGKGLA